MVVRLMRICCAGAGRAVAAGGALPAAGPTTLPARDDFPAAGAPGPPSRGRAQDAASIPTVGGVRTGGGGHCAGGYQEQPGQNERAHDRTSLRSAVVFRGLINRSNTTDPAA